MTIDSQTFRRAMGQFATGVTVVTTLDGERMPVGLTVSAFSSLSLDPPLVLVCLDKGTFNLDSYLAGPHFVVNMLSETQQEVSNLFASSREDKFDHIEVETWNSGCPVIPGSLCSLECRLIETHEGGDHHILIGRVERLANGSDEKPLLYFRSGYAGLED